jgi:hypothetical protein
MPSTEPGKAYHWAEAANAALADITRYLFSATSAANKQKITDLENQLKSVYATEVDASVIKRSEDIGKEVAKKVAEWADTDGWKLQNNPYTTATTNSTTALALGTYCSSSCGAY